MSEKFILDACCGGRMFWKNKNHPNVIYQDIRKSVLPLKKQYGMNFTVEPDVIGDYTKPIVGSCYCRICLKNTEIISVMEIKIKETGR